MARFYSNENIAVDVVIELRKLGHDVLTSFEAGKANSATPDAEVLAFATAESRVLLSHNRRHFLALHRHRTKPHSGMILCTFDADFRRQASRIHAVILKTPDFPDQVIRVNRED